MSSAQSLPVSQWKLHQGVLGKFSIKYTCPSCSARLTSPVRDAGKTDTCPQCRCSLLLPTEPGTQAESIQNEIEAKKAIEREAKAKAKEAARLQAAEEERLRREQAEAIARGEEEYQRREAAKRQQASKSRKVPITSTGEILGLVLGAIGLFGVFAGFRMDVSPPGSDTVNLDLMQNRQNWIIVSCFMWLIGIITIAAGSIIRRMPTKDDL
jgi:hypothetical protein